MGGRLHFPREKGWGSLRVVATPLVKSKSAWVQVTVGCPPPLELVMVGQDRVKSSCDNDSENLHLVLDIHDAL